MAAGNGRRRKHFILKDTAQTEPFKTRAGGAGNQTPRRDRHRHGHALLQQLTGIKSAAQQARDAQVDAGFDDGLGLSIEFESFPDIDLAFESLARERSGIELLNVRRHASTTSATVFVPDGKLQHFEKLVEDYLSEKKDSAGRPRDNQRLVDAIDQIRAASIQALWTDSLDAFPTDPDETIWWEVWLPTLADRKHTVSWFRERAAAQGISTAEGEAHFPERVVLLAKASTSALKKSITTLNSIAELRRAKETAEFFDSLAPSEQPAWMDHLLQRVNKSSLPEKAPHVCVLDTGASRGHPWLEPFLSTTDLHTVNPNWGTNDSHGHGTQMAGLALIGDLTPALEQDGVVDVSHRLESVKLLESDGANGDEGTHHAYLTTEAVARPEITAPIRQRVFCMAVTARDKRTRGAPSSWSSAIDKLAADSDDQGTSPRLFLLAAGNIDDPQAWSRYPTSNDANSIQDPAQAWNALSVGGFTTLVDILESDDSRPVAPQGGLSPFSSTSLTWNSAQPLKPEIVLEAGNAAENDLGAVVTQSLSLLTAHHEPTARLFTTCNATSAATAQAAAMAAQIMAAYPDLWPETVRALMVHSASWTPAMLQSFLPSDRTPNKRDYLDLVRRVGFGVPSLESALWSMSNSLTMVAQDSLQPFTRSGSNQPTVRDMHLYDLPWPQDQLMSIEGEVELRVTLSYFIEPSPSARGPKSRYRYESHGLRFDVKRPSETQDQFRKRVNVAAREDEESTGAAGTDAGWLLGTKSRHVGSIHSDIWRGTAADLAGRGVIAVYPTMGWWKTRPKLERHEQRARYSLTVSISTSKVDVDLLTEVENQISLTIATDT